MIDYLLNSFPNSIYLKFFKFSLVGVTGLLFESIIISILIIILGEDPAYLRFITLPMAICLTWYLNRRLTFKNKNKKRFKQLLIYYFFISLGLVVNYIIFYITLNYFVSMKYNYILALAFGSISSMGLNFLSMVFIIFNDNSFY